jgi:heptosyltransferase-2
MKFLVIRFSSIGDIVLTTPVLRNLAQQVPGAVIHYLTKPVFAQVLDGNPHVRKVHLLKEDFDAMIRSLKAEQFDAVIDLHSNVRTLRVKQALGLPSASFRKLNLEKWLLTSFKWDRMPRLHIVDRYLETVARYQVNNDGQGLDYFIPQDTVSPFETMSLPFRSGYIALVAGAAHFTKRIPIDKMREICMRSGQPVLLLGGKDDRQAAEKVAAAFPGKAWNSCGRLSLHQSAMLLRDADWVISSDTGLMHIAAALRKKLVVLWGNTVPAFGMYPYYGTHPVPFYNLEVEGLSCRPCSKIGHQACPKKHFRCMQDQSAERIAQIISEE